MFRTEIAELMQKDGIVFDVAEKVNYKLELNAEEKEISEVFDAWAREIGKTGKDNDKEIAAFVRRIVQDEIYNAPDELLDQFLDRGSIGEFDWVEYTKDPKNTLIAHEAAKGGTVDRSWIDFDALKPITKNRQIETDISYTDLRRDGFKSVAKITTYAKEALQNALFHDVFGMIDAALIPGGEQYITSPGGTVTLGAMDELALYLLDRSSDAVAITTNKYAKQIGRMTGYDKFMSEAMKNDFNRYGLVRFFDGVKIASLSGAAKGAKGELFIPDQKIYGVAGKVGNLDMRGQLNVYQDMDNSNEKVIIRVKDFTYSVALTNIENAAKISITG